MSHVQENASLGNKVNDRVMSEDSQAFADKVGSHFSSLPHLPEGLVDFLVTIAPYMVIISAILSTLFVVVGGPLLAIFSFVSLLALNPLAPIGLIISLIATVIQIVLMVMAYQPLLNREYKGWMLLFWMNLISAANIVADALQGSFPLFGVFGLLIGLYILFEMRPRYQVIGKVIDGVKKTISE